MRRQAAALLMLQQEEEFERGTGSSAPARTNGWHHGSGNQRHLRNTKKAPNGATCKAKTRRTSCRQEDAEEPSRMTSSCHTGLARYARCEAALNYQEELLQVPCTQIKSCFGSGTWQGRSPHDHPCDAHQLPLLLLPAGSGASPHSGQQDGDRRREASGTLQGGRGPSFGTTPPGRWPCQSF